MTRSGLSFSSPTARGPPRGCLPAPSPFPIASSAPSTRTITQKTLSLPTYKSKFSPSLFTKLCTALSPPAPSVTGGSPSNANVQTTVLVSYMTSVRQSVQPAWQREPACTSPPFYSIRHPSPAMQCTTNTSLLSMPSPLSTSQSLCKLPGYTAAKVSLLPSCPAPTSRQFYTLRAKRMSQP